MQMFTEYVAWQNYAATQFAQAEVAEEGADREVRRIEAMSMVMSDPKPGEVKKTMAARLLEGPVQHAYDEQMKCYASRKMTQVVLQNCERCAALISRELSRRIGGSGIERRNMRWNA